MDQKAHLLARRYSEDPGQMAMARRQARRSDFFSLVLTVVGGFLVHVSLCLPYTFGRSFASLYYETFAVNSKIAR